MNPIKKFIEYQIFHRINNFFYPEYYRQKYDYLLPHVLFFYYLIPQKILRINGKVPWPVHFTSEIRGYQNIKKGIMCDPGDNPNIYIQANNGIIIGHNVGFGAGTSLISANHNHNDHSIHDKCPPITIGNNVFVGTNSVILPGVKIGDNVVIGAGSIVAKDIPSNSIAVGNPCRVIKQKEPYIEDFTKTVFNRKLPEGTNLKF
ncbi:transferase hexapeptide (six repeat-containing protein) [Chryseobacterium carnipullorum]|uniref:acyltransferase n=1 Tax=Chryseobacterium carnipullorum TaxID=1124835 RepID=UPI00090ED58F|nr:acyltransferase [Chryseobacterium carnipullorum]SHL40368.1 transferase hexapeptide (six repeat-containing protein) [Chryseobacterium carnipullorum]